MKKLLLFFAIVALLTSCNSVTEAYLEADVSASNKQCPMSMGNGLTMTKIEKDSNYVIYHVEGDSDLYQFSNDLVTEDLKNHMVSETLSNAKNNASVKKFVDALIKLHIGVVYHYYTSSGSTMDVVLESERFSSVEVAE
ncbi:MAG: hypothetical protein MJZ85_08620 [Bacteroidales bacterium]|nr:hypothetical protein [Bacteroidales bacterium]